MSLILEGGTDEREEKMRGTDFYFKIRRQNCVLLVWGRIEVRSRRQIIKDFLIKKSEVIMTNFADNKLRKTDNEVEQDNMIIANFRIWYFSFIIDPDF